MKTLNVAALPNAPSQLSGLDKMLYFEQHLQNLTSNIAVVVFPIQAVFTVNEIKHQHEKGEKFHQWIQKIAINYKKMVIATSLFPDNNHFYYRTWAIYPNGSEAVYDQHQWVTGGVHPLMSKGNQHLILQLNQWKIMMVTGDDLYFPEWIRMNQQDYHAIFYIGEGNIKNQEKMNVLLKARAIENEVFILSSIQYSDHTERIIILPDGQIEQKEKGQNAVLHWALNNEQWQVLNHYTQFIPHKDTFILLPPDDYLKVEK